MPVKHEKEGVGMSECVPKKAVEREMTGVEVGEVEFKVFYKEHFQLEEKWKSSWAICRHQLWLKSAAPSQISA